MDTPRRYRVRSLLIAAAVLSLLLGAWRWYCFGKLHHQSFDLGDQYELRIYRSVQSFSGGSYKQLYYSIYRDGQKVVPPTIFARWHQYPFTARFDLVHSADGSMAILCEKCSRVSLSDSDLNGKSLSTCLVSYCGLLTLRSDPATTSDSRQIESLPVEKAVEQVAHWNDGDIAPLLNRVESVDVKGTALSAATAKKLTALPGLGRVGFSALAQPISKQTLWVLLSLPAIKSIYLNDATLKAIQPELVLEMKRAFPAAKVYYYDIADDWTRDLLEEN
ncbi:hypothetical protein NG895_26885 [Aeoliella sp. ICT_H6.2]|uniref:Uncharacterized protein n=1 Tax=Aeoliella straminimaris TaxID=2954799 RepID=A0A9X2JJ68_9BACT|nr:hypothetical protein [Aeoliella straminimaris]MCO6047546.1 hypothetical protein [Aeoliella straminimaris]